MAEQKMVKETGTTVEPPWGLKAGVYVAGLPTSIVGLYWWWVTLSGGIGIFLAVIVMVFTSGIVLAVLYGILMLLFGPLSFISSLRPFRGTLGRLILGTSGSVLGLFIATIIVVTVFSDFDGTGVGNAYFVELNPIIADFNNSRDEYNLVAMRVDRMTRDENDLDKQISSYFEIVEAAEMRYKKTESDLETIYAMEPPEEPHPGDC